MEKSIRILAVALAVQLLLAVGLSYTGPDLAARAGDQPLLSVARDRIDRLTIEGPDQARVVLAKSDGGWHLPDEGGFPADGDKIGRLLTRLAGLKRGPAVATSGGALTRFKVSDSDFERRITLAAGDTSLATLYLGSSPAMRHVHARTADDKAVYAVEFASYDAPVKADDWEDHDVLQFPANTVKAIEVDDLHVQADIGPTAGTTAPGAAAKPDDAHPATQRTWHAEGLPGDERLAGDAVEKLIGLLAKLRVGAVLGREAQPDSGLDNPAFQAVIGRNDGKRVEYRLGKVADKEEYTLKTSLRPEYFRLPSYTAKPLIEAARRGKLVTSATPAAEPTTLNTSESPER